MSADYEISLARPHDIPGILTLQQSNLIERGGGLSVRQTADWFKHAIVEKSMVVARSDGKVIGYVLGFARCASAHTDHSSHVARFPPPPDCYLYGPVCVAEGVRGKGLAAALFKELQTNINGRPAMIFIRADNVPSLRAHQKMEMSELGAFMNEGALYIALGHRGRCPLWS